MSDVPTIAITGAGSGIGAAIAQTYAQRGARLFLAGRTGAKVRQVGEICQAKGCEVNVEVVDVQDHDAVDAWIANIEADTSIDLMIVNAGIFGGRERFDALEPTLLAERIVDINLTGAIRSANAVAARMMQRKTGHIVLISSLAARFPSPDAPAYSASKAGLTAFGEALREDMAGHGVTVTIVHPGHVRTAQTDQQLGPLDFVIDVEDAAARIVRGIDAKRSEISFPLIAAALVRLSRLLPWQLRRRINARSRFTVRNEPH